MFRKRRNLNRVQPVKSREDLEAEFGKVFTVQGLAREFIITSIIGNKVVVRRKADDVVGTLDFQGSLYFNFQQQPADQ